MYSDRFFFFFDDTCTDAPKSQVTLYLPSPVSIFFQTCSPDLGVHKPGGRPASVHSFCADLCNHIYSLCRIERRGPSHPYDTIQYYNSRALYRQPVSIIMTDPTQIPVPARPSDENSTYIYKDRNFSLHAGLFLPSIWPSPKLSTQLAVRKAPMAASSYPIA